MLAVQCIFYRLNIKQRSCQCSDAMLTMPCITTIRIRIRIIIRRRTRKTIRRIIQMIKITMKITIIIIVLSVCSQTKSVLGILARFSDMMQLAIMHDNINANRPRAAKGVATLDLTKHAMHFPQQEQLHLCKSGQLYMPCS